MHPCARFTITTALALLALPATAGASFKAQGDEWAALTAGETLVVRVDGAFLRHDQVGGGFTGPFDFNNVDPGEQRLPADSDFVVTFTGGGNRFSGLSLTGPIVIEGGDGADRILTGSGGDTITGGGGPDQIDPGAGRDTVDAGQGDDTVTVAVNTDADELTLGGGEDEIVATGTPGDDVRALTDVPGGLRLKRAGTSETTFTSDAVELFEFRGNDGEDALNASGVTGPLAVTFLGGRGADNATGTANGDVFDGGEGNDVLTGLDGEDLFILAAGADEVDGGGQADAALVLGSPVTDEIAVAPNGTGGINAAGHAIFETENLAVRAGAGADRVDVAAGASDLAAISLFGEDGDDVLTGAGNETLHGGRDNDTLTGGPRANGFFGDEGDDTVLARDGAGDGIDCGTGADRAVVDAAPLDRVNGCETVELPPPSAAPVTPPASTPPAASDPAPVLPAAAPALGATPSSPSVTATAPRPPLALRATARRLRGGVLRVTVRCPAASPAPCRGTVRVVRGRRTIAARRVTLRPGARTTFRVRAAARARVKVDG